MIVRRGMLSDISAILEVAQRILPSTNYAPLGYNAVIARRNVQRYMTTADARVWVVLDKGKVVGFLMAELGALPHVARLGATDFAFLAERGGDLLLDAFIEWCKLCKVARIDMGISAGPEREAAIRRAMARKGFVYSGPMFHMNLLDEAQGAP